MQMNISSLFNEYNKTSFKSWLRLHNLTISFIKADGSERVMNCTLRPEALPTAEINMTEETAEGSNESVTVWDLDKKAWRRFKPSTVKSVYLLEDFKND